MKTQHERIKLFSDSTIQIKFPNECNDLLVEIRNGEWVEKHGTHPDREALDARVLAENCFLATGSFRALRMDNAIPFVGKQVLLNGKPRTIVEVCSPNYVQLNGQDPACSVRIISPIGSPKPEYLPLTPEEAIKHLGRKFHVTVAPEVTYEVRNVSTDGINYKEWTWEELVEKCVWSDTDEPVGTKV